MALSEELTRLLDYLLSLRSDRIRSLLARHTIPRSGPKRALRERLQAALEAEELSGEDIAAYLEEVEPWGSQHVYLYNVKGQTSGRWQQTEETKERLEGAGLGELLGDAPQLVLPEELTLASISLSAEAVEVRAVEARHYTERVPDLDINGEVDGTPVEYHAYTRRAGRGLFTLSWDLLTSQATLHISKAHRGYEYEEAEERFTELIEGWLDLRSDFKRLDLRKAIEKLAKRERDGATPLTRSPKVSMQTAGGREIAIASADAHTAAAGEQAIDPSINEIAKHSRGRMGNVYWLDKTAVPGNGNPLVEELHTMLLAADSRIHFKTPSEQSSVEYVLRNVRALC